MCCRRSDSARARPTPRSWTSIATTCLSTRGWSHELTYGARAAYGNDETDYFVSDFGTTVKGAKARTEAGEALTTELFLQDRITLHEGLDLVVGGQWAYAKRKVRIDQVDPGEPLGGGFTGEDDYHQLNPKLGFTWQIRPKAQVFGNISRSFEPPSTLELGNSATDETLDAQDAWTVELGSRGNWRRLSWQVAGYYAWLNKEILVVETPPGTGHRDPFLTAWP